MFGQDGPKSLLPGLDRLAVAYGGLMQSDPANPIGPR